MINGGIITINEEMLNNQLKSYIHKITKGYLTNYNFILVGDSIILDGTCNIPKIGTVKAGYMFKIVELTFCKGKRILELSYMEDLSAGMDPVVKTALALLKKKGTALSMAVSHLNKAAISENNGRIFIDLTKIEYTSKIPENITINYIGADAGKISFGVNII